MTDLEVLGGMDPFRIAVAEAPDTTAALLPTDAADRLTERIRRLRDGLRRSKWCPWPTYPSIVSTPPPSPRAEPTPWSSRSPRSWTALELTSSPPPPTASSRRSAPVTDRIWSGSPPDRRSGGRRRLPRPSRALRPASASTRRRTGPAVEDRGIALVDADRIVAELGGADHASSHRSATRRPHPRRLPKETVRVLDDIGFFGPRPLVAQIGAAWGWMRYDLNLPHLDRRVGQARLLEWHVAKSYEDQLRNPLVALHRRSVHHSRGAPLGQVSDQAGR